MVQKEEIERYLRQSYQTDLEHCQNIVDKISEIAVGKNVYFELDSWKHTVIAENITRKQVHLLAKELHKTFYWHKGCGGKKIAKTMEGSLEIILITNIDCPTCKKPRPTRGRWLWEFFRVLVGITNWKATIVWSWRRKEWTWIGKGYNPDYSMACTGSCGTASGNCPNYLGSCAGSADCRMYTSCPISSCGCPAPSDPNSHQAVNNCYCSNTYVCTSCILTICKTKTYSYTCACASTCSYDCNVGFTWNGIQCIPIAVVALEIIMDGFVFLET